MTPLNTRHRTTYFEWHVDSFVVGAITMVEFCDDAFGDRRLGFVYDCLIDGWNQHKIVIFLGSLNGIVLTCCLRAEGILFAFPTFCLD